MADVQGFMFPRTATGRSSLVPNPPWHYSGTMLTLEYRTDPAAVAELLPAPLELADDDPGAIAVIWADWQSCSDTFEELLDPIRSQYLEAFVVARCKYRGEHYSRCLYIWVDRDYAMVRGHHQGYPKKLGSIHITRPVELGKAGPRLAPGRPLRRDARRLRPPPDRGHVRDHRHLRPRRLRERAADDPQPLDAGDRVGRHRQPRRARDDARLRRRGRPQLHRHVRHLAVRLADGGAVAPAPRELIAGYWREVATRWKGGTTLERHLPPSVGRAEPGPIASPLHSARMPAGFSSSDETELIQAERDVQSRIAGLGVDLDFASLAAVSNIFRAATMVRNHMERTVLAQTDLSFTAFTVLWVLWIWGEQEARRVAEESGVSRGTLTGVIGTLEARGLVHRRPHPDDRRSVLMSITEHGDALMQLVYPQFNREEGKVSAGLDNGDKLALADALRTVLRTVESLDS